MTTPSFYWVHQIHAAPKAAGGLRPLGATARRWFTCIAVAGALGLSAVTQPAQAHGGDAASALSTLSALPVAVSVVAPSVVLATGSVLTLVAIQAVAEGTVWVLRRASDGAQVLIHWGSTAVGMASVALGTAVTVTVVSAGWVLSAAGEVLALVPNALGQALLHHEEVMR